MRAYTPEWRDRTKPPPTAFRLSTLGTTTLRDRTAADLAGDSSGNMIRSRTKIM
jgi:hypothetical protein